MFSHHYDYYYHVWFFFFFFFFNLSSYSNHQILSQKSRPLFFSLQHVNFCQRKGCLPVQNNSAVLSYCQKNNLTMDGRCCIDFHNETSKITYGFVNFFTLHTWKTFILLHFCFSIDLFFFQHVLNFVEEYKVFIWQFQNIKEYWFIQ